MQPVDGNALRHCEGCCQALRSAAANDARRVGSTDNRAGDERVEEKGWRLVPLLRLASAAGFDTMPTSLSARQSLLHAAQQSHPHAA